jgi:hypothetical protein
MGVEAGYLTGLRASGEAGSRCFEVAYVAGIYLLAVFNIETPAYRVLGENWELHENVFFTRLPCGIDEATLRQGAFFVSVVETENLGSCAVCKALINYSGTKCYFIKFETNCPKLQDDFHGCRPAFGPPPLRDSRAPPPHNERRQHQQMSYQPHATDGRQPPPPGEGVNQEGYAQVGGRRSHIARQGNEIKTQGNKADVQQQARPAGLHENGCGGSDHGYGKCYPISSAAGLPITGPNKNFFGALRPPFESAPPAAPAGG